MILPGVAFFVLVGTVGPLTFTISNTIATTGSITTTLGDSVTLTITNTSGSATGQIYASDGTPIAPISGSVGEMFTFSLPSNINIFRVDWADAVGSLTFNVT